MTREQAKEILPIIEAFSKGKTVERFNPCNGEWDELKDPSFDLDNSCYRIKPEPKCRPFKNNEECLKEMLKHNPFGWIKTKTRTVYHSVGKISKSRDGQPVIILATKEENSLSLSEVFNNYTFVDGTPFGINLINMKD